MNSMEKPTLLRIIQELNVDELCERFIMERGIKPTYLILPNNLGGISGEYMDMKIVYADIDFVSFGTES